MPTADVTPKARRTSLWRRPLLVGFCTAMGYGLTQRLLDLRLPGFVQWGQSFELREMPGTSLESLRLQFGLETHDLRGRLDPPPLQQPSAAPDPAAPATSEAPDAAVSQQGPPTGQHSEAPAQEAPPAPQLPPPDPSQP